MQRPPGEVWNSWQSTGGARVIVVCWLWPFAPAVTVAFWPVLTLPETASNVALTWPAGTVTLAGTVSNVLLLAIDTTESLGAAAFKLIEHLPDLLLVIAEGEQDSDLGCPFAAALALRVKVWEAPFSVAVSNAF